MISLEEAVELNEITGCKLLEEYVIEIGENLNVFEEVLKDVFSENINVLEFIRILKDLWIENNMLHKVSIFIRQCFADSICRANLTNPTNKNSKFARSLIMIDTSQAIKLN